VQKPNNKLTPFFSQSKLHNRCSDLGYAFGKHVRGEAVVEWEERWEEGYSILRMNF